VAHRLSTIRHADLILVLESGRVIESGTHSDLLAHRGTYARLIERQIAGVAVARAAE
jgi:ABC-type multidrug transport system fused ATPase/permease subunit